MCMLQSMARRWFKRLFKHRVDQVSRNKTSVDVALRHNSVQHAVRLYHLPQELLLMIAQHLTDSEVVTLMLCCTCFWHDRNQNGIFGEVWRQIALPVDDKDHDKIAARFYILRMLEYDGLLQGKYCCWGCMKAHEQRAFSSDELIKPVDLKVKQDFHLEEVAYRSCRLTAERYIWFGMGNEMSFVELRHTFTNPQPHRLRDNWIDIQGSTSQSTNVLGGCSSLNRETMKIEYRYHLAKTHDIASYEPYRLHARAVNLPLCPHFRLDHPHIYHLYRQPWHWVHCLNCPTMVMFGYSEGHACMFMYRYVGSLRSPTDTVWKAQSYRVQHQRLEANAQAFCDWYERTYASSTTGSGSFKRFADARRIRRPFKGVRHASFLEKADKVFELLEQGHQACARLQRQFWTVKCAK